MISARLVFGILLILGISASYVAVFGIGHSTAMLLGPLLLLMLPIVFVATLFSISELITKPEQRTVFNIAVISISSMLCVVFISFIIARS